jgi:hypothetical protein
MLRWPFLVVRLKYAILRADPGQSGTRLLHLNTTTISTTHLFTPAQCAIFPLRLTMPRQDRIDLALSQLVEHTVPVYAEDDEDVIEERLNEAYAHAHDLIDAYV